MSSVSFSHVPYSEKKKMKEKKRKGDQKTGRKTTCNFKWHNTKKKKNIPTLIHYKYPQVQGKNAIRCESIIKDCHEETTRWITSM